jgi:hypothetical protein
VGEDPSLDVLEPSTALPLEPFAERVAKPEVLGMARREVESQRLVAIGDQNLVRSVACCVDG